ncbi:unnamed protein product [Macrosiphum euphorbiae]|nr:unnamed protein product [Macrosiphum euphorbiae]
MDIKAPNVNAAEDNNENLFPTFDIKSMETVSSTVPNITNDEIIDIIDITADDDITLENFQDHEKTILNVDNDEINNITNISNTDEDFPRQFSCDTKLIDNDLQINNFRTSVQNKYIELITISDNSDDENTSNQQSIKKPNSFKSVSKRQVISTTGKTKAPYYRYLHNRNRKWEEKNNRKLRPIIIDGLNIGHAHGLGTFSVKGIEICIKFFTDRGHKDVLAFIPVHQRGPPGSERKTMFDNLYNKGQVCFTPSRKINNLRMTCREDRMMLGYANKCDGVVVSNDNFRDLYDENEAFKEIIEKRLVMVTFVKDDIIVPEDQYNGRTKILYLSDILCFPE